MPTPDFGAARKHYQVMREVIIHHPGGWPDDPSIRQMQQSCRAALRAVEDRECAAYIEAIEGYAADLFSEVDHRRWTRKQMTGADFLRLQILRELEAFHARLLTLETSLSALSRAAADGKGTAPQ
ncbi:MAG TPA: hypothetical protein VN929_04790 [Burkholderiales bacterium]|nr:hypothetical protein [Burkholderiales bacterium]